MFLTIASGVAGCSKSIQGSPDPMTATSSASGFRAAAIASVLSSTAEQTSVPWQLAGVDSARRELQVEYFSGDPRCVRLSGSTVARSGDHVVIGIFVNAPTRGCDAAGYIRKLRVRLPVDPSTLTVAHARVSKGQPSYVP